MYTVWRSVKGFEDLYLVSNEGKVMRSRDGYELTPNADTFGYPQVWLNKNGVKTMHRIHCLVAAAFIGDRPLGFDVAHLDGTCKNNLVSNLKYCSRKENLSHKILHGTSNCGERAGRSKLKLWQVREILESKDSCSKIGKKYGVSAVSVSNIRRGKTWSEALNR